MSRCIDLTGQKFGRLTVIKRIENQGTKAKWLCKCECGNFSKVTTDNLRNGHTKSCKCSIIKHKYAHKESLYFRWIGIKERCNNPNAYNYKNYGLRGIKVCKEWNDDYLKFRQWALNNGYKENLTIDRINVNGNYEPANCRWTTWKEQNNNKRRKVRNNV